MQTKGTLQETQGQKRCDTEAEVRVIQSRVKECGQLEADNNKKQILPRASRRNSVLLGPWFQPLQNHFRILNSSTVINFCCSKPTK
jgi:hypothetical protein